MEIRTAEDVGSGVVEIRLINTVLDSPTGDEVLFLNEQVAMYLDLYQLMMKYAQLVDPE